MTADKIIQCHQRIFVTTAKAITIEDYFVAAKAQDNRDNAPSRLVLPTNMPHQIVPLCRFHEGVRGVGSRLRRDSSSLILLQYLRVSVSTPKPSPLSTTSMPTLCIAA